MITGQSQSNRKIGTGSVVKALGKVGDRIEMSESSVDSMSWREDESSGQVSATTRKMALHFGDGEADGLRLLCRRMQVAGLKPRDRSNGSRTPGTFLRNQLFMRLSRREVSAYSCLDGQGLGLRKQCEAAQRLSLS